MSIINQILKTTSLFMKHVADTSEHKTNDFKYRCTIDPNVLRTANVLKRINIPLNCDKLKLEHFKLKQGATGNCIIFPLFKLKDEHGREINSKFLEHCDVNRLYPTDGKILDDAQKYFKMRFIYFPEGSDKDKSFISNSPVFILENPATNQLKLYVLVKLAECWEEDYGFEDPKVQLLNFDDNFFEYEYRVMLWPGDINYAFTATDGQTTEKYIIDITEKSDYINIKIIKEENLTISLLDSNIDNGYIIIKPLVVGNDSILKACLVSKSDNQLFEKTNEEIAEAESEEIKPKQNETVKNVHLQNKHDSDEKERKFSEKDEQAMTLSSNCCLRKNKKIKKNTGDTKEKEERVIEHENHTEKNEVNILSNKKTPLVATFLLIFSVFVVLSIVCFFLFYKKK
ncbi:hypothetical protein CDIK_2302 [Cucumispora dikerogammari]|nr:hypothetical protein CDIK_2302 [Cucumispora dikerogammari]